MATYLVVCKVSGIIACIHHSWRDTTAVLDNCAAQTCLSRQSVVVLCDKGFGLDYFCRHNLEDHAGIVTRNTDTYHYNAYSLQIFHPKNDI